MARRPLAFCLLLSGACADNAKSEADSATSSGTDGEGDGDGTDGGDDGAQPTDFGDPLDWALQEPGPFRVGHAVVDWSYAPASGEGTRTVPVHIWYPTEATTGETVLHLGVFEDAEALGGAPAAPSAHDGGYPVFAYSHGYQGYGGTSAFLMGHLATHGFVAIAPDHVNNLITDHADPLATAHYIHRPQDVSQSIDALEQGAFAAVGIAAGAADTSRVIMSGHSFGVYTTWLSSGASIQPDLLDAACSEGGAFPTDSCTEAERSAFLDGSLDDPRVVGSIPMAGGFRRELLGTEGPSSVHGPWLLLTGSLDDVGAQDGFDTTTGLDLRWAELEGGCHQTFALGICETLDPAEGFALVETLSLAFVRSVLLGDPSEETAGVLDGTISISDKVHIQHNGGG